MEVYLFQSNAVFMHICDIFNPLSDVKNFVIWFESLTVIYEDRVVKNVMHKAVNKLWGWVHFFAHLFEFFIYFKKFLNQGRGSRYRSELL